jgi:antitoxin component YwqK of YwqJK toxin-antitoxin module
MEWLKYFVIQKNRECVLVNAKKQGIIYIKHPNGYVHYAYNYDCGQLHGTQLCWSKNGNLSYESNYNHGLRHGVQRGWFENGRICYDLLYINGIKQN